VKTKILSVFLVLTLAVSSLGVISAGLIDDMKVVDGTVNQIDYVFTVGQQEYISQRDLTGIKTIFEKMGYSFDVYATITTKGSVNFITFNKSPAPLKVVDIVNETYDKGTNTLTQDKNILTLLVWSESTE